MEQALKSSVSARGASSSISERQLADSIPIHDEDHRKSAKSPRVKSDDVTSSPLTFSMRAERGPVAMSIPAILKQNIPGFKARNARIAQLQSSSSRRGLNEATDDAHDKARQKLGRRKQRRWENAHFYGSKHMVPPRASDYSPAQLSTDPIFPSPPPSTFFPYKPSSDPTADPNARAAPTFDDSVTSADYGRFSLPMKGLKRNTRRIVAEGGIGGQIVQAVDAELRSWLEGTEVWLSPETIAYNKAHHLNSGRKCICEVDTEHGRVQAVSQIAKQPHALVWQSEDSFTRFLIHAIARYYRVVSFTKTDPTTLSHLIWLLRPNMSTKTSQDPAVKAKSGFETPPTTASEWEASSMGALTTSASEIESLASGSGVDMLSAEEEASGEASDGEPLEHDADVTIVEIEADDAILLTTSGTPSRRRKRNKRPSTNRALSDIDSGAEVDDEREVEDETTGVNFIRQRVAEMSLGERAGTPRGQSGSSERKEVSGHRLYRSTVEQTAGRKVSNGWRLPERSFAAWVLAS